MLSFFFQWVLCYDVLIDFKFLKMFLDDDNFVLKGILIFFVIVEKYLVYKLFLKYKNYGNFISL